MDYRKEFDGKFNDKEVRIWYNEQDKKIGEKINTKDTLENQAKEAHRLRNLYKQQARNMMNNRKGADNFNKERPLQPFEFYVNKYLKQFETLDDVYKAIIDSSMRPNKQINQIMGLED